MRAKGFVFAALLAAGLAGQAAEPLKSGPQPGEKVPGQFRPLNVTGPDAGKEECLYCKNGARPVVMVFAREVTPAVAALIKKLDAATAANVDAGLATAVIVLSADQDGMSATLARWAKQEQIGHAVLAIFEPSGPIKYQLSPDAAVTVLLYAKHTVKANHAFRPGELTDAGVDTVLADVSKILPRN